MGKSGDRRIPVGYMKPESTGPSKTTRLIAVVLGFIIVLLLIWKLFYIPGIEEDGTEIGHAGALWIPL